MRSLAGGAAPRAGRSFARKRFSHGDVGTDVPRAVDFDEAVSLATGDPDAKIPPAGGRPGGTRRRSRTESPARRRATPAKEPPMRARVIGGEIHILGGSRGQKSSALGARLLLLLVARRQGLRGRRRRGRRRADEEPRRRVPAPRRRNARRARSPARRRPRRIGRARRRRRGVARLDLRPRRREAAHGTPRGGRQSLRGFHPLDVVWSRFVGPEPCSRRTVHFERLSPPRRRLQTNGCVEATRVPASFRDRAARGGPFPARSVGWYAERPACAEGPWWTRHPSGFSGVWDTLDEPSAFLPP